MVDDSGVPSTDTDFFQHPQEWAHMLHAEPEEALLLSAALLDVPDIWNKAAPPMKLGRMSYHTNPSTIVTNSAARVRFLAEAQRLLPVDAVSLEFLHMFPIFTDPANQSLPTRQAEAVRLRALGTVLLQPHFHLMRAFLTWLPMSHADELPMRLASQPEAFSAELQHATSTSNAMMPATAPNLRDELYDMQNECLPREVQPNRVFANPDFRPQDPVTKQWLPHLLYRPSGFTFTRAHGDFVTRHIIPGEPTADQASVHLPPARIRFWECEWLRLQATILSAATSPDLGGSREHPGTGRRTPRVPNIFIIPPEARDPRAGDAVYDLRA